MKDLRLLDRRWHVRYSARRLDELVARCHERGLSVTPHRLAVIRAPLASATPRRRAVLPFENSECDLRAEGIFALVKRRTPQSPDHSSPRVTLSSCRGLQRRRRIISSRQGSYLLFAKVYLRAGVTLQARTHRDKTHPTHHHATDRANYEARRA